MNTAVEGGGHELSHLDAGRDVQPHLGIALEHYECLVGANDGLWLPNRARSEAEIGGGHA